MSYLDDGFKFLPYVFPVPLQHFANVDHHVELDGPSLQRPFRFSNFNRGRIASLRKSDHRTNKSRGTGQHLNRQGDRVGLDADTFNSQTGGQLTALAQLLVGHGRVKQGMIDQLGDRLNIRHGKSSLSLLCVPISRAFERSPIRLETGVLQGCSSRRSNTSVGCSKAVPVSSP